MTRGQTPVDSGAAAGDDRLELRIDGARPLSAETVAAVAAVCDRAEDLEGSAVVVLHVSGSPSGDWAGALTVKLVNRWEQVLRRLERLPATTIAGAVGDCGGPALDALLATDHRMATASVRLILPVQAGLVWPGMALYRLARQAPNAAAVRHAALFGSVLDVRDALTLHLVHEVVDDLPTALAGAVARASLLSGTELAVRRQLAHDAQSVGFEEALGPHLAACDRALRRIAAVAAP
ncbi:enoyl-CoA-hydratase DpgB [Plantactinospora soyae]|uniref:Isomerase DpgB n=1 Tax=Plantactinospora soyae TaxID=1544732 RepID=A0A927M730_9ACTN|nr:enoyl-CoA-hydratase DpgB [Plantactinospora soyae]MBE1489202.1 isomerase DpgB [Plantactinospora soyae]